MLNLTPSGTRMRARLYLTGALVATLATGAHAQDNVAAQENVGLEEIVVTAQKRAENVQDTPLSVTAVTASAIEAANITTVKELNRIDPALQIGHATGTVTTFIRGIGNPVTTAGNEASVPIFIDDVYFVRASVPFFNLANIERIEVLKGPQGTLFGRNASGGVVSIYTRDPGQEETIEGKVGYGNFKTFSGQLYAAAPLGETLAADLSVSAMQQDGGWGRNIATDQPNNREKYISLRSKWIWTPTDSTRVRLIGYYQKSRNEKGIYQRPFPGTVGGSPDGLHNGFPRLPSYPTTPNPADPANPFPSAVLPALGFYDTNLNYNQYDRSRGWGGSLRIDQELGFADFVSISAIRRNKELYYSEGDNSPYDQLRYQLNILDRQFTQEFQLKSTADSDIKWILGAFYLNALQGFDPTNINGEGTQASGISNVAIIGRQRVKSLAGFGQVTYPVTDNTNVTVGLRYTSDKVTGQGWTDITFLPGVFGPDAVVLRTQDNTGANGFSKRFNKLTYKFSADHHFTDDVMAYASYSRGFKAGTHNTLPLDSAALKPEVVDAYEIGLKSELLDRRLRLNVALFWNDIQDPQVQAQRNGLVALINAGSARTKGVEFDATAAVADGLTLRVGATYLDAKFRDFTGCPTYTYSPTSPGNLDQGFTDCSGNRMPYASKFKSTASINYDRDIDGLGSLALNLSANYAGRFNWDGDNVIKEKAHTLFDGSVTLHPASLEHFGIKLWMRNITGVKYNINYYAQASGSAYSSAPGEPRAYGAELLFKF